MIIVRSDQEIREIVNDVLADKDVVVVDSEGRFLGVVDKRAMNIYRNYKNTKVERVTKSIVALTEHELNNMQKIIEALLEHGEFIVVVDSERKPIKLIHISEIKDEIMRYIPSDVTVRDVMDTNISTVSDKEDLENIKLLMFREGLDYVIVIDQKKKPIGIISYDEILLVDILSNRPGRKDFERVGKLVKRVSDILLKELPSLSMKTPISEVLDYDVAVVYDRVIKGIIKRKDVLRMVLRNLRYTTSNISIFGLNDGYSYSIVMRELVEFEDKLNRMLKNPRITARFKKSKIYEGKLTVHSDNYPILIAEDVAHDPGILIRNLIGIIMNRISRKKKGKKNVDTDI
ncbi:MAG: CBS domain-containing protein [Candidatus Anstonellales archaeon]